VPARHAERGVHVLIDLRAGACEGGDHLASIGAPIAARVMAPRKRSRSWSREPCAIWSRQCERLP
jgi:hypothetical protein